MDFCFRVGRFKFDVEWCKENEWFWTPALQKSPPFTQAQAQYFGHCRVMSFTWLKLSVEVAEMYEK